MPTIEVRYENLNIEADAYVGSRGLPTFINFMTNFLEVLQKKKKIDFFNYTLLQKKKVESNKNKYLFLFLFCRHC